MKLAAIYNVWDGVELLKGSMNCIKNDVDLFIIVYQEISNYGEVYNPLIEMRLNGFNYVLVKFTPGQSSGQPNETKKRQLGIDKAKELNCTHFIAMDCDEYYEDFSNAKKLFLNSRAKGSVCKMRTYFKSSTLRLENPEGYYVPFIHELHQETTTGSAIYPFYCDRTRQINEQNIVELPIFMHHFSWVRKDIYRKLRNSSAKRSRNIDEWASDYNNPDVKEGFYLKDFQQKLVEVKNIFNISLS